MFKTLINIPMTSVTTSQFRENLAEIVNQVVKGQEVILVMGNKKIKLTNIQEPTQDGDPQTRHKNIKHIFTKIKDRKTSKDPIKTVQKPSEYLMQDYLNSEI
jgi:antitoxin (DNA-binding transcriptional repressor) of toxin-antitoxin stability system